MATAQQIATRALRRIRVVGSEDTVSAADMTAATEALDAMIASWEAEGLSGDVLPLSSRFDQAVTAMLAVRLAEEYGKEPGAILMRDATEGWAAIQAAHFVIPKSTFDAGLIATGYRGDEGGAGSSSGTVTAWTANAPYVLRQFVVLNGYEYECTMGGTSGTVGPSGTGPEITDGTVVWCWRRTVAADAAASRTAENNTSMQSEVLWDDAQW